MFCAFYGLLVFLCCLNRDDYVTSQDCGRPSAVGLENQQIPDSDITSSSQQQDLVGHYARINNPRAWCAETRDKEQWVQIDLKQFTKISFMAIQGDGIDAWIKSFYIQFSSDNITWYCYGSPEAELMTGNVDSSTIRFVMLIPELNARYFRVNPQTWNKDICLRLELYGCTNMNTAANTTTVSFGMIMDGSCSRKSVTTTVVQEVTTTTAPVKYDALTPIRVRIPQYIKTNYMFLVLMYPHFGTDPIYKWDMGDGHRKEMIKRFFHYTYTMAGVYNVTVIGINDVSQQIGSSVVVVQDEIKGLRLLTDDSPRVILPDSSFNVTWELAQGSNVSFKINLGDGSQTITKLGNRLGLFSLSHIYDLTGDYKISITAYNKVGPNITVYEWIMVRFPSITNITTSISVLRTPYITGRTYYICVGDSVKVFAKAMVEGYVKCLYNYGDTNTSIPSQHHMYNRTGTFEPTVICQNNISSLVKSFGAILVIQYPDAIKELSLYHQHVTLGKPASFLLRLARGSCFVCHWRFGDGAETTTDFSHLGSAVNHSYESTSEYNVSVLCSNIKHNASTSLIAKAHIPIEGLRIQSIKLAVQSELSTIFKASTTRGSYVNFTVDFRDGYTNTIKIRLKHEYFFRHSFKTPGIYNVTIHAFNAISTSFASIKEPILVQNPLARLTLSTNSPIRLSNGIAVFKIRKEANTSSPTNATCTCRFGDGNKLTTKLAFDDNSMVEFSHHFLRDMKYQIIVTCSNMVSRINLTGAVHVHDIIYPSAVASNHTLGIYCRSSENTSLGCYFPLGVSMLVNVTTQALDKVYMWNINNTSGSYWSLSTSRPYIQYTPLSQGVFFFNISVENALENLTCGLRLVIQQKIVLSSLFSSNFTFLRSPTVFTIIIEAFGTDACYSLRLGDGNQVVFGQEKCMNTLASSFYHVTRYLPVRSKQNCTYVHYYQREGDYTIELNGFNKVSSVNKKIFVKVQKPPCRIISMNITLNNNEIIAAEQVLNLTRSVSFLARFEFSVDCKLAESTRSRWLVQISNKTNVYSSSADLSVLQYSLKYGRYKFIAIVEPIGKDIDKLYNNTGYSKSFYVDIVPSQLIAYIIGGPERTVGYPSILHLEGSNSYDPDTNPDDIDNELRFQWFCVLNASEPTTGCFNPNGRVSFSNRSMNTMNTASFKYNRIYSFELVIFKHGRTSSYHQSVRLLSGAPPSINIRCTLNCANRIVASSDMILTSICKDCVEDTKLLYHWTIKIYKSGWKNIELPLSFTTTGFNLESLVIRKGFFLAGFTYRIHLHTWRPGGQKHFSFIQRDINTGPVNGTCMVTPKQGEAMSTLYWISCAGWSDSDMPLTYRFTYQIYDDVNVLFSGSNHVSSYLPIGDTRANFTVKVIAEIKDSLGSTTQRALEVQVNPPTMINYTTLLAGISEFDSTDMSIIENKAKFLGQVIAISSFLNTLSVEGSKINDHSNKSTNASCMCDGDNDGGDDHSPQQKENEDGKEKRVQVTIYCTLAIGGSSYEV